MMKINKWLKQLAVYLSMDERKQAKKRMQFKAVLKNLRIKEKKLKRLREDEKDKMLRRKLQKKINALHVQRKKGLKQLKSLKE